MSKRIILADDEAHVLDVLSMKLQRAGFEVTTASDGQRALELCLEEPPDLIITDCQMPVMDGLELCRQLRAHEATSQVLAIMLSAREFEVTSDVACEAGIEKVLPKPFSPREILETATQMLDGPAVAVKVEPEPNQMPGSADPTSALAEVYENVSARARKLQVNTGLWNHSSVPLEHDLHNPICRKRCGEKPQCLEQVRKVVQQAQTDNTPCKETLEAGCCAVALPLRVDGRTVGAISLDLPLKAPAGEEPGSDADLGACRFLPEQADDLTEMICWAVESEQAKVLQAREVRNLSSNLSLTYEELDLVYRLSADIRVNQEPENFLKHVLEQLSNVLDMAGAALVVYPRSDLQKEETTLLVGSMEINPDQLRTLVAGHIAPRLADETYTWIDNNFQAPEPTGLSGSLKQILAARLDAGNQTLGVLACFNRTRDDFDSVDAKLVNSVAAQCATFLSNQRLYSDLEELFWGVLRALTASIDAKDAYTGQHSDRVADLSRAVAEKLGLSEKEREDIYLAGMLHDIGKIGVPEAILRKPGKLDDEEFEQLKKHPALGGQILQGIRQLEGVVSGIVAHHERPDGRGYPAGLTGQDIPIAGRIIAFADSFDAMTSNRPYRDALPMEVVMEELRKGSGGQFDEKIVEIALSLDLEAYRE
jgi:response regulator RpfG family c-di-GMP phosphodiesterase